MLKRNTQYNIDDVVRTFDSRLLKCTKAGITSNSPIDIGGGANTITDGSCEWQVFNATVYETLPVTYTGSYGVNEYTVPEDGLLYIYATHNTTRTGLIGFVSYNSHGDVYFNDQFNGYGKEKIFYVRKGETVSYKVWDTMSNAECRFIYSNEGAYRLGLI